MTNPADNFSTLIQKAIDDVHKTYIRRTLLILGDLTKKGDNIRPYEYEAQKLTYEIYKNEGEERASCEGVATLEYSGDCLTFHFKLTHAGDELGAVVVDTDVKDLGSPREFASKLTDNVLKTIQEGLEEAT